MSALAAVYEGDGVVSTAPRTPPVPGPGQVRLDIAYTGICGTDLHVVHGSMDARVDPPAVIGHETAGRIGAVGAGVTGWDVGRAATVMPTDRCGTCPACTAGHDHVCHRMNFLGVDAEGAMQSSWIVPAELLVPLPDDLPLDAAALVEPTAVAVHDVTRAEVAAGEFVVVVGGGPVGLLIAMVARARGARVLVVEIDDGRRAVAESLALNVIDPTAEDVVSRVEAATAGAGAAVAFEVSGADAGINTAVDVLAVRGRLGLVAIHPQPKPVNLHRFFWRELTLVGARLYRREDMAEAIALIADGSVPVRPLISQVIPLTRAPQAFEALAAGGAMKVLVDCRGEG
ncbi:zinc-dependent alcohol dehydrogenase [Ruania halotolerans]|uniref:zinc-dependent alcohol dehydrogenase n=1 Tax=Ruania halotolerans TaxID=2897773 RepID=UPI001E63A292|nr:alcohol dehydrogenase catalytic domain-containing protein [Ruania halotolerans]UFU07375.1 alcohol dehydrogenase catalytic domain-containing protein [Ruania halotolerans]